MKARSVKRTGLLIGLIMSIFGCNLQQQMLYYPSHTVPAENALTAAHLRFWPSRADYRGFIGTQEVGRAKGTVVVFHGNAGTAEQRSYYAEALVPLGYRVILAEYPGYGSRPGELSEASLVSDARQTIRLAARHDAELLIVLGESLGCGVAAAAANDPSLGIDALMLITPWDTLLAVARSLYPLLPVGLFLKDKYDSVENLRFFQGKIAVIGAERDEILPLKHAVALYDSLTAPKKMWIVKGAGHNDWSMAIDAHAWREFMDFFR